MAHCRCPLSGVDAGKVNREEGDRAGFVGQQPGQSRGTHAQKGRSWPRCLLSPS